MEDGYKTATELRQMYQDDPDAKRVIDVARGLEGLRRQDGIHAAAVVITHDSLTEHLPIQRKPEAGKDPSSAPIVTQYEMHGVSDLGLLKMDFLGLRNLSVIERTLDVIEAATGERIDIDNVDLDDEATFEMLQKGDVDRGVPARGRPNAFAAALARPDQLRRRGRPRRPVPARARWRPTCTTTTPTARTTASRASTCILRWRSSSTTPSG